MSVYEKISVAEKMVSDLNHGDRKWIMSIPPRFDRDPDLVITDALHTAKQELLRLRGIPDDGTFHHRLGVDGLFGVMERMAICRLLREHIEGKPVVDRTEEETAKEEFDYDIAFPCACCGEKSTNYLCGKCAPIHRAVRGIKP